MKKVLYVLGIMVAIATVTLFMCNCSTTPVENKIVQKQNAATIKNNDAISNANNAPAASEEKTNPLKNVNVTIDSLVVFKKLGLLKVYGNNKLLQTLSCGVGPAQDGHKQKKDDNRTPEGLYHLTEKNPNSVYYKNFHIDYPNATDVAAARAKNINPGGDIKLHGYADANGNKTSKNIKFSSTWGCVGVTNADMDELYRLVQLPAPILLLP